LKTSDRVFGEKDDKVVGNLPRYNYIVNKKQKKQTKRKQAAATVDN